MANTNYTQLTLIVNNQEHTWQIKPGQMLLEVLRENGLTSVKGGCHTGSCGLCTVWLNDKPVLSCTLLAMKAAGQQITTLEGVQQEARELADFLVSQGAEQCGFCSPGTVMTILAMKRDLTNPTIQDIKTYMAGNLCRCSGYVGQERAIMNYLGVMV